MSIDRAYRVDQIAEKLNCSKRTVYRLIEMGKIKGTFRFGTGKSGLRVRAAELEDFMKREIEKFELEDR